MSEEMVKLIAPPSFREEERRFGEAINKSLGGELKGEAFSTKIETPDPSKTFPDVSVPKYSADFNYTWRFPSLYFCATTQAAGTALHSRQMVPDAKN